jgi:hypothetical protein
MQHLRTLLKPVGEPVKECSTFGSPAKLRVTPPGPTTSSLSLDPILSHLMKGPMSFDLSTASNGAPTKPMSRVKSIALLVESVGTTTFEKTYRIQTTAGKYVQLALSDCRHLHVDDQAHEPLCRRDAQPYNCPAW